MRLADFFLVDTGGSMPRWCQLDVDGDRWIDAKGRGIPRVGSRALAHVQGETIEATLNAPQVVVDLERDAAARYLLDPWSDQGWLAPNGRFYGCAFFAHDDLALAYLRKPVHALEAEGFVRVHADGYRTDPFTRRAITSRQRETLAALGFHPEGTFPQRAGYSADRSEPAPVFAVKPPARLAVADVVDVPPPVLDARSVRPLLDRLREHSALASFVGDGPEFVTDLGGGNWKWLLHGEIDVGSGEHPATLLAAPGIYLHGVAFDQAEIFAWHEPGVHLSEAAVEVLGRVPAGPSFGL